jgi:hypothetical protein
MTATITLQRCDFCGDEPVRTRLCGFYHLCRACRQEWDQSTGEMESCDDYESSKGHEETN